MVNIMTILELALYERSSKYKVKTYSEFEDIVGKVVMDNFVFRNRKYCCEVQALLNKENEILVMIECARNIFPLSFFGKHKYFAIKPNGEKRDISSEEYWALSL
jgi:hypothetical protein